MNFVGRGRCAIPVDEYDAMVGQHEYRDCEQHAVHSDDNLNQNVQGTIHEHDERRRLRGGRKRLGQSYDL